MQDEANSFLSALVEKEALFFFFLSFISILLIVFNKSTVGTHTLDFPPNSIRILTVTAITFGGIGTWQLIKKKPSPKPTQTIQAGDNLTQAIINSRDEMTKINQEQKVALESLKQAIKNIQSVAAQERSYASVQILEIIESLNIALINFQESSLDASRLAQWARVRIDVWVEKLKPNDYPNIQKQGNFKIFKEDIVEYLNLFCENVSSGWFKAPTKHGIKPHFDYPFAYKDALKCIRKQIISELDDDEFPDLTQGQRQELLVYLEQLIDDI